MENLSLKEFAAALSGKEPVPGGGGGGDRHPILLGGHGASGLPGLLPGGPRGLSHELSGHGLLRVDAAGLSGPVRRLDV